MRSGRKARGLTNLVVGVIVFTVNVGDAIQGGNPGWLEESTRPHQRRYEERSSTEVSLCSIASRLYQDHPDLRLQHSIQPGDTLSGIADRYRLGERLITCLNPWIDENDWLYPGQKVSLLKGRIRLEIGRYSNQLSVYLGDFLLKTYLVSTGRPAEETPAGIYRIRLILPDPYDWKQNAGPGDPRNRFGSVWIGLNVRRYGIHGTNEPSVLGRQNSEGCVRMNNHDVLEIAGTVRIGTTVTIN